MGMDAISVGGRGVSAVVRFDSEDLLQSVMKEIAMMLLLLGCVGGAVLGFKLCVVLLLIVGLAANDETKATTGMMGRGRAKLSL
jgi:hypothetical protein